MELNKFTDDELLIVLGYIEMDIRSLEKEIQDIEKKTLFNKKINRDINNLRALKTHYIEEHIKVKTIRDKIKSYLKIELY
jgi:hypothetical protein